jgi:putative transposase
MPKLAVPIKVPIEAEPSFGYLTVEGLLEMSKNTVQRIYQRKGWQVRKRSVGHRSRSRQYHRWFRRSSRL